jgi:hypothetical protein
VTGDAGRGWVAAGAMVGVALCMEFRAEALNWALRLLWNNLDRVASEGAENGRVLRRSETGS